MNHRATLAAILASILLLAPVAVADGTLTVFLGADAAYPTADLRSRLPDYRALAEELGVGLELRTLEDGAPAEVVITPLVVFRNHRGRSIYQGRYDNLPRLRNFVRTARVIPQSSERLVRENVAVRTDGRARIAAPLKLTTLTGDAPAGFDAARFAAEARRAIAAGMDRYELAASVELGRGDRLFYVDAHPYRDGELLFVSCEIYSQFNCHVPILSALDDPVVGFWDDRELLFEDVGRLFQEEIDRLRSEAPSRDAFTPVSPSVPVASWSELGLDLPPAPAAAAGVTLNSVTLPERWTVVDGEASSVLFRFAPPLEAYAGEAQTISGQLSFDAGALSGARGAFRVPVASITMGEPLLDKDLQSSGKFNAEAYPVSSYTVEAIASDADRLRFGEQANGVMRGRFELKGLTIPVDVRTSLEPIIDADGRARLLLTARWTIRIGDPFGLTGPDGPMPARDTVEFTCTITLRPEGRSEENRP